MLASKNPAVGFFAFIAVFLFSLNSAGASIIPAPPQLAATGYLLIDADSGKVLVEHNAEQRLPPASLTKMLTSYIAASEIVKGNIALDDQVLISVKAWRTGGSKMFIREGTRVSVENLERGIIIQSGNDASVALAEHIAGAEEAFADLMNGYAQQLGMVSSQFKNATGLPMAGHYTTAKDLAVLAKAIINDYPEHYKLYSEKYFTYNDIRQPNRNRLLWRDNAVDGIKTGHTDEAGYCLVSSAKKNNMRLISVVMGTRSEEARAAESQKLLTYGFRFFETHRLYEANSELKKTRVWGGQKEEVSLGISQDLVITIPRGQQKKLGANLDVDRFIEADVVAGTEYGLVSVMFDGENVVSAPLVALETVEQASFFKHLWDSIVLFFVKLFK